MCHCGALRQKRVAAVITFPPETNRYSRMIHRRLHDGDLRNDSWKVREAVAFSFCPANGVLSWLLRKPGRGFTVPLVIA